MSRNANPLPKQLLRSSTAISIISSRNDALNTSTIAISNSAANIYFLAISKSPKPSHMYHNLYQLCILDCDPPKILKSSSVGISVSLPHQIGISESRISCSFPFTRLFDQSLAVFPFFHTSPPSPRSEEAPYTAKFPFEH